jgi:hypothetical protein
MAKMKRDSEEETKSMLKEEISNEMKETKSMAMKTLK